MSDTQWRRFIVFHQAKPGEPHQYSGSVHAPDAELALLNARDVFVRRPECVSLWVVRVDQIFAKTAEELALDPTWLEPKEAEMAAEATYCVFLKLTQKGSSTHVGDVQAASAEDALRAAIAACGDRHPFVWWVCPERAITRSTPEDIAAMFDPVWNKREFRDQGEFHTVAAMQQIKGHARED
jgi:ring-1,2-phenylacetyl-CoA epoxidase subunit PaaB